jgi:hypothetical protein
MKQLMMAVLLAWSGAAFGYHWVSFGTSLRGTQYWAEDAGVQDEYWTRVKYPSMHSDSVGDHYTRMVGLVRINCSARSMTLLQSTAYLRGVVVFQITMPHLVYGAPHTFGGYLTAAVCNK